MPVTKKVQLVGHGLNVGCYFDAWCFLHPQKYQDFSAADKGHQVSLVALMLSFPSNQGHCQLSLLVYIVFKLSFVRGIGRLCWAFIVMCHVEIDADTSCYVCKTNS